MSTPAVFWDRLAERYAAQPIKDQSAYEKTLERVRTYLSDTDEVLEVGCGTGSTALILAKHVRGYTGTDISGGMIEIARRKKKQSNQQNLKFERASVSEALKDNRYDVIMGFNLLHLLRNPEDGIAQMRSALRPGGYLITKTPCIKGRGFLIRPMVRVMQFFGKAPYVGFHSAEDIDTMFADAGLEIVETGNYPAKPTSRFVVARRT